MKKIKEFIQNPIFITTVIVILILIIPNLLTSIKLTGKKHIILNYGEEYIEPGYSGTSLFKDITSSIKVKNNIEEELGKHKVTYSYKFWIFTIKQIRIVEYKDMSEPRIVLTGGYIYETNLGEKFIDPGYAAVDNYDGVITKKVTVTGNVDTSKMGEYELTYNVEDSSKNKTIIKRTVKVVKKSPLQMTVEEYTLDGFYDEIKLKEATGFGNEYCNEITIVGDDNVVNMYKWGYLYSTRAWGLSQLDVNNLLKDPINIYGFQEESTLVNAIWDYQPTYLIINFGAYNTYIKEKDFINKIDELIQKLKEKNPHVKIMLSSIYPVTTDENEYNFKQKTINNYNFHILETANKHDVKFLDIASILKDQTGYADPSYFLEDSIYLNTTGQSVVRTYITNHPNIEIIDESE